MENWLVLGLIAAVSYSISGLATKVVLDRKYLGLEATSAAFLVMVGVMLGFMAFYAIFAGFRMPQATPTAAAAGIAVGLFWSLGSIMVYYALIRGADVSRMAPVYNLNTLLVVIGAIVLLHELPERAQMMRVIAGAILITLGGILVST